MNNPYPTLKFRAPDGKLRGFDNLWPDRLAETLDYIALGLSGVHRFNGYGGPYTVAQHCCLCDDLYSGTDLPTRRAILLHDAAEALTGDLPKPWKALLPDFQNLERHIRNSLILHLQKIGLPFASFVDSHHVDVGRVDDVAMKIEAQRLFGMSWREQFGFPPDTRIEVDFQVAIRVHENHKHTWTESQAREQFTIRLHRAFRLTK